MAISSGAMLTLPYQSNWDISTLTTEQVNLKKKYLNVNLMGKVHLIFLISKKFAKIL